MDALACFINKLCGSLERPGGRTLVFLLVLLISMMLEAAHFEGADKITVSAGSLLLYSLDPRGRREEDKK